jgi:predicted nucleic acid-binding Zn ribbon protein
MPTYTFKCPEHSVSVDIIVSIGEFETIREQKRAPLCGCGKVMEPVIQLTSFVLRGSGWARDGYSGGKK